MELNACVVSDKSGLYTFLFSWYRVSRPTTQTTELFRKVIVLSTEHLSHVKALSVKALPDVFTSSTSSSLI